VDSWIQEAVMVAASYSITLSIYLSIYPFIHVAPLVRYPHLSLLCVANPWAWL
jgi:hypothetical protein